MRRVLSGLCLLAAAGFAVAAAWIPVKAQVAQVLLRRAWDQTRGGAVAARPWPWADTWPVGRLRAPRHGVDFVVLAGASGSSLAFAPGHIDGTALPGACGACVISGHRDTHFRFLADLQIGDAVELEGSDGALQRFTVQDTRIVDGADAFDVAAEPGTPLLILTTCYPFDAIVPGGPLRYVVVLA